MDDGTLRRSYRRLLRAYPRWWRRERGLEMMTTLLDAAAPGQRGPTPADVVDLLVGGLRCRLRIGGAGARLVGVTIAVFAALVGSAALGLLAGRVFAPTPTAAHAAAVAETATAQRPHDRPGPVVVCDYFCPDSWTPGGDQVVVFDQRADRHVGEIYAEDLIPRGAEPAVDHATVVYWTPVDRAAAAVGQARDRLAASGWAVGPTTVQDDGYRAFWAVRDGTVVLMGASTRAEPGGGPPIHLLVSSEFPPIVAVASAVGFVGGLAAGWAAAGWVLRRLRRHGVLVRAAVAVVGLPAVPAAAVVGTAAVLLACLAVGGGMWSQRESMLPAAALSMLPVVPGVAAVCAVAALALAALPARGDRPTAVAAARLWRLTRRVAAAAAPRAR